MDACSCCEYAQMHHVLHRQGVSPEVLKLLFDQGVLSDVVEAAIFGAIPSRDELRSFFHLKQLPTTEHVPLSVEYKDSFASMLAAGNYAWIDRRITERRFFIRGAGVTMFEAKLFHFNRRIVSEEAKSLIVQSNILRPWRPASVGHVLAFGAMYPDMQQQRFPIIALNATCLIKNVVFALCLESVNSARILSLKRLSGPWFVYTRFLAVRELCANL